MRSEAVRTKLVGMTNPANFPAPMCVPETAHPKPASDTRHVLDLIGTVLLSVAVVLANCGFGFLVFLGMALSGMGCDNPAADSSCPEADAFVGVCFVGLALLVASFAITFGGMVVSARKSLHVPMVVWPLAGALVTAFAALLVLSSMN